MLNAWFMLVVTLTKWLCASTAFDLGWVQFILTSTRWSISQEGVYQRGACARAPVN